MCICFLICGTFLTRLSSQIFDLRFQKKFTSCYTVLDCKSCKTRWKEDQLDLVEANEAFAAQAISVNKELGFNSDIVNVNGGAIALGHPIGASGARVLVTLLHEMKKRKSNKGLATLCIGGGMGIAMCVESVS